MKNSFRHLLRGLQVLAASAVPAATAQAATFTVTNTSDASTLDGVCDEAGAGDGCSLREAVAAANADASTSDTITFRPLSFATPQTILLVRGQMAISSSLSIEGPGAKLLTISGNRLSRHFAIDTLVNNPVALSGLTLANGREEDFSGGSIIKYGAGALELSGCVLRDNRGESGGAILHASARLTISGCTFSNNEAGEGPSGAIDLSTDTVTSITNSTFVGNRALNGGGAIASTGSLSISNSTLTGNSSVSSSPMLGGGAIRSIPFGGPPPVLNLSNTIVAGNVAASDPDINGDITSSRFSIVGGSAAATGLVTDAAGNPLLLDNGGATPTVALVQRGSAVDAGDPAFRGSASTYDQRGPGFLRVRRGRLDIGAFEAQDDLPIVRDFSLSLPEDPALFVLGKGPFDAAYSGAQASKLLTVRIESLPTNGLLLFNNQRATVGQEILYDELGGLVYRPESDFNGSDSFLFNASDFYGFAAAPATVNLQILPVNDAPTFLLGRPVGLPLEVDEDAPAQVLERFTQRISPGPADESGQSLAFSVSNSNPSLFSVQPTLSLDGTLRFTPAPNASGNAVVSVVLQDDGGTARGGSDATTLPALGIRVRPVNDAPVAQSQERAATSAALPLVLAATDIDSPPANLNFILLSQPQNGTLSGSGSSFRYTPRRGFAGTDSFTFRVNDGQLNSNVATVTLRVANTNVAPAAREDSASTQEGTPVTVQVLANDSDADGDALAITAADAAGARGAAAISADKKSIVFTPDAGFVGATGFGYTVTDGLLSSSARVSIQVQATPVPPVVVNVAPVAAADFYSTRGPLQVLAAQGVLANDTDADGGPLRALLKGTPGHGEVSLGADGSFTYTPAVGYSGGDSFSYAASDGAAESAPVTVTLQVASAPDVTPPALVLAGGGLRVERRLVPLRGSSNDVYVTGQGAVVSSGLKSTTVQLQRSNGDYWNGRAYQKAPFSILTPRLSSSFFTIASGVLPPLSQAPGGRYLWTATATDNAGNITRAQQFMLVDSTAPSLAIATPAAGRDGIARVSKLGSVGGRVSEASRVEVALRNGRGLYFNGRAFASAPTFLAATSAGAAWTLRLPANLALPVGRYSLVVRATDAVGNVGTAQRVVEVASAPAR